jgi:hypothetical protein
MIRGTPQHLAHEYRALLDSELLFLFATTRTHPNSCATVRARNPNFGPVITLNIALLAPQLLLFSLCFSAMSTLYLLLLQSNYLPLVVREYCCGVWGI